jgi:hypothetical protein
MIFKYIRVVMQIGTLKCSRLTSFVVGKIVWRLLHFFIATMQFTDRKKNVVGVVGNFCLFFQTFCISIYLNN